MAKDVNIHLKTTGAEQTKADLDRTGQSAKQLGDKTAEGQKRAGAATEQGTKKLGAMGRMINTLKTQVMGFIGAFLGIQAVVKVVTYLIRKLERVAELQKEIYEKSLQFAEIGQALEFQTGTLGKQQFWSKQAIELQKAGALRGPDVAQQMLVSADIAFADLGGVKNKAVRDLAKQLAPFVGAAGLGGEEVSKLFEFAGAAGIEPTADAYKQYFAQLHAGYTASKATDFGQFMMGLQKGGTAYTTMGGTLEEAISTFAAARSVMANESLAATLVEQVARLSGGGYEKPRAAMEQALGVTWSDMSMDERTAALLQYVGRLPQATRTQTLVEQGFPQELTTGIGKMVSPEAMHTLESTRQEVAEATASMLDEITQAYLESMLGKERQQQATIAKREAKQGPDFADWQRRMDDARSKFKIKEAANQDLLFRDALEPFFLTFVEMYNQLKTPEGEIPSSGPARRLALEIRKEALRMGYLQFLYPVGVAKKKGYEFSRRLNAQLKLQESAQSPPAESPIPTPQPTPTPPPESAVGGPVTNNFDHRVINQTIFNPLVGMNKQDLRIEPPYLA